MKKETIFRADDYFNNMGNFLGFFETKEEAEDELTFTNETETQHDNYSQITEFQVDSRKLCNVKISDNEKMLSYDIWGDADIIKNYYYE